MSNFNNIMQSIQSIIKDQNLYVKELEFDIENMNKDFDSILIKKLAKTNTITHSSTANQTHIAFTSNEMDIFPYLQNYNYLESEEKITAFKRRFLLELPVVLSSNNLNYLRGEGTEKLNKTINSYTTVARSKRSDGSEQIELSYIDEDSMFFTDLRKLLYTGDYIIFLKYRKKLKYMVLGIKEIDEEKYNLISNKGLSISKHVSPTRVSVSDNLSSIVNKNPELHEDKKTLTIMKLLDKNPNLILYGPSGTGKTHYINKIKNFFDHSEMITFHQSYSYEQFIEGLTAEINNDTGQLQYFVKDGIFLSLCKKAKANPKENYVLLIDEINRGNISNIFGELITLIERTKRLGNPEEIIVKLPYSNEEFSVPNNLYIIGTMNTSDKSIALIDIALRRRFTFFEITPDFSLIKTTNELILTSIEAVKVINKKIENIIDREHVIGHSYFFRLLDTPENELISDIRYIWMYQILPLLQEYFYTNSNEITSILGDFVIDKSSYLSFSINYEISDEKLVETLNNLASKV